MLLQKKKKVPEHVILCLVWHINLPCCGDSIAACLLRSDSQCKTAQRGELSPLPASLLPGQTERKPSSSWNKARRLRAKCWMDEPCRSTHTDAPLRWSDLCRCRYQIECTCRCSTTQDWFMEMFHPAGMNRDAAFFFFYLFLLLTHQSIQLPLKKK